MGSRSSLRQAQAICDRAVDLKFPQDNMQPRTLETSARLIIFMQSVKVALTSVASRGITLPGRRGSGRTTLARGFKCL